MAGSPTTITQDSTLSRVLTDIENGGVPGGQQQLLRMPVREHILGVTGPPGAGKSTIVDRLIGCYRNAGHHVGVLAVDPTSPYTGGAFLGDRVRMMGHVDDPHVFIRSMGSRGVTNGLAPAVSDAARALSAYGYGTVIIETVGVGQVEVGIADVADLRLLILTPSSGDWVQANKAGILEIADIIAVNKSDLPGARDLVRELREARPRTGPGHTDVLAVSATADDGLAELHDLIQRRVHRMRSSDALHQRRQESTRAELETRVRNLFIAQVLRGPRVRKALAAMAKAASQGEVSAADAAEAVLAAALGTACSSRVE